MQVVFLNPKIIPRPGHFGIIMCAEFSDHSFNLYLRYGVMFLFASFHDLLLLPISQRHVCRQLTIHNSLQPSVT